MLWYGSRHYDPELGRFIQPDSIVPVASQGVQAYDRYAYVNNNPVRYTDPSGHMTDESEGGNYTWQEQIHDAYLERLELRRSWEGNNRWEIMAGALRDEPSMEIVGHGLEVIKQDPAVIKVQDRLWDRITHDPRYGVEEFLTDSIGNDVELGNKGIDAFNDDTWTQRHAKLDATSVVVHKDGSMVFLWSTRDTLDLTPSPERGFWYNAISVISGTIWHEGLGASRTMTTRSSWQTIVYPYCQ